MVWIWILCGLVILTLFLGIRYYQYREYQEKVARAEKYVKDYKILPGDFYLMPDGSVLKFCCDAHNMHVPYLVTDGKITTIWETRFLDGGGPLHISVRSNADLKVIEQHQLARRRFSGQRDMYESASPLADKKTLSPLEKLLRKKRR